MPFYEYECQSCKHYCEIMQKISDLPLRRCPSCGRSTLKKLISAPVFRLKGSGWYETDFKSDKEEKRNLVASEDKSAEAKAETAKSDAGEKPAEPKAAEARPADSKPAAAGKPEKKIAVHVRKPATSTPRRAAAAARTRASAAARKPARAGKRKVR